MKKFLLSSAAAFQRDSRGNVAMIFGIAAVPIMLSVTAAYDYSRAIGRSATLQSAADQAILSALASSSGGTPNDTATRAMITASLAQYPDITLPRATGGATVVTTDGTANAPGTTTVTTTGGQTCTMPSTALPQTSDCSNTTLVFTPATSTTPATYQVSLTANVKTTLLSSLVSSLTIHITSTALRNTVAGTTTTTATKVVAAGGAAGTACITMLEPHEDRAFDMEGASNANLSDCEVHTQSDGTVASTRTWDNHHDDGDWDPYHTRTQDVDQNGNSCNPDSQYDWSGKQLWTTCAPKYFSASFHNGDDTNKSHEACAKGDDDDMDQNGNHQTLLNSNPSCTHVVGDPFSGRFKKPTAATCQNHNGDDEGQDNDDNNASVQVAPGTYCGNVQFHGKLKPGLYIIKTDGDGNHGHVTFKSGCHGDGVTFRFDDDSSDFDMDGGNVHLHAPDSSDAADYPDSDPDGHWGYDGVLMFKDASTSSTTRHPCEVEKADQSDLHGLIYTPNWDIHIKSWDNRDHDNDGDESTITTPDSHMSVVGNTMRVDGCNHMTNHPGTLTTNRYPGGAVSASFTTTVTTTQATSSSTMYLSK